MNDKWIEYSSYLVGVAAIIGLVRIRTIGRAYYPFIILLWLGIANEIVSTIVIKNHHSNAINSNIYVLLESLLILAFFLLHGLFKRTKNIAWIIGAVYIISWVVENFFIYSLGDFSPYFGVLYSFITVILSITLINRLLVAEKKAIWKHPAFIICTGFILFYTCNTVVEIFWVYGVDGSKVEFVKKVYRLIPYVNLLVNIIYVFAVLWIPRKHESTLL